MRAQRPSALESDRLVSHRLLGRAGLVPEDDLADIQVTSEGTSRSNVSMTS